MGADMYAKKGKIEINFGRVGYDYESLIIDTPIDGGDRILTIEHLQNMSNEIEKEIDNIETHIAILVAYCPNKKNNDLQEKMEEYNDWIQELKSNMHRQDSLYVAMDLIKEGFKVGISY